VAAALLIAVIFARPTDVASQLARLSPGGSRDAATIASLEQSVPRLGYLCFCAADWPAPFERPRRELFSEGLGDLGYVEGQNIVVEYRFANGDRDQLALLTRELIDLNVDVIVLGDSSAMAVAKEVTSTLPLVMTISSDPVGLGWVQSLVRPGGNLTGQSTQISDLTEKRLDLVKATVPVTSPPSPECVQLYSAQVGAAAESTPFCLAILWDQNLSTKSAWDAAEVAAQSLGIALISVQLQAPGDFEEAIVRAKHQGAVAAFEFGSPFLNRYHQRVAELCREYGLPLFGIDRALVQAGALQAYTPDYTSIYKRAAGQAIEIVRGADPAEMPVEQPTRFQLIVNQEAADALGIKISDPIMRQATEVMR